MWFIEKLWGMNEIVQNIMIVIFGISSGMLVSGGVFTVLLSVGLTPRFAGKTGTASYIIKYENGIILGTLLGAVCSVIPIAGKVGLFFQNWFWYMGERWGILRNIFFLVSRTLLVLSGFSTGIFVGCLAMAIAEMLDSIPIFTRRISFHHGLGFAVIAVAVGKMVGGFFHLWFLPE